MLPPHVLPTTSNGEANQTCQHFAKSFQTSFLFLAFGRKQRFATDRHSHSAKPLKSIYASPPWSSIFSASMPSEKTKCWKMLGSDPRSVAIVANLRVPVTFQHLPTVLVNNPMPNSCMSLEAIRWIWESSKSLVARLSSSSKSFEEKTSLSIFATTMSSQLEPSLWFTFFSPPATHPGKKNTAAASAACRWGRFSCSHTQPVLLPSQVLRASSRLTRELQDFFSTRLNTDYSSLRTAVMPFLIFLMTCVALQIHE